MIQIEWRAQVLKLTHNWRCRQPEWLELLDDIGMGRCKVIEVPATSSRLDVESVIAHVWSDAATAPTANKAVLTLTLEDAATVNQQVIDALPGASIISLSVDTYVDCKEPDMYPEDFVRGLHMSGVPHGQLELKVGARYIIIRNIDFRNGVVNGAHILCTAVTHRHITGAD
jgi:PIF1-like helicase